MREVTLTIISQIADDNGVSTSQSLMAAGDLAIDGALASMGVATFTAPSYVSITSAADDTGITWTVTGTDKDGGALSETITGADTAAATTTHRFLTVTQISGSGATAGNVIAGTADFAYSEPCPLDYRLTPFNVGLFFVDTGTTSTFTVQYSGDDPWDAAYADADAYNALATWFSHPFMAGLQANSSGNIAFAVRAVRLQSDQDGTDTGKLKIVQSGH